MVIWLAIGTVAKQFGVSTQTVRNWCKKGILEAHRTPGGHRRFDQKLINAVRGIEEVDERKTVVYARVRSHDQKNDLQRQTQEIEAYCEQENLANVEIIRDIGSGINYEKRGLKKLIREILSGQVARVVVSFQDRLVRFGSEILFEICRWMNVEVLAIHDKQKKSFQEKLVEDVLAILIEYSSKIYGRRSHEKRRKKAQPT